MWGGYAIVGAIRDLVERAKEATAERLEIAVEDLEVLGGDTIRPRGQPSGGVQMSELGVQGQHRYEPEGGSHVLSGANVGLVRVDPYSGGIELERYAIAYEVGRAINPLTLEGQVRGAAAQGIGGALLENFEYTLDGQPLSTSFLDYALPTAMEIPNIDVILLELGERTEGDPVSGAKGAGEGGIIAVAATITNAVADAVGSGESPLCSLPLTPEIVQRAANHEPQPKRGPRRRVERRAPSRRPSERGDDGSSAHVGRSIPRVEDGPLLVGHGQYLDDLEQPGQVFARIVRSEVAHGRLLSVSTDAARALPGIVTVITGRDIPPVRIPVRMMPSEEAKLVTQPALAIDTVRYVGEPVAVVVATNPYLAEDAANAVGIEIDPLPPLLDGEQPRTPTRSHCTPRRRPGTSSTVGTCTTATTSTSFWRMRPSSSADSCGSIDRPPRRLRRGVCWRPSIPAADA